MAKSPIVLASRTTPRPVVKKPAAKPPAKVGSKPDPYNAVPLIGGLTVPQIKQMSPQQIALYGAAVQSAGPDYSKVPHPNFQAMQKAAWSQAGTQVADQVKPYQAERANLQTNLNTSRQAATAFAQAFASIAGGGNANIDDPAAQKHALENYGGSYVGAMAAQLGAQLINQQQAYFNETDGKYAAQIKQIMDTRPDLAEKIYTAAADDAAKQIKEGKSIADMSFKNKLGAIAALGKAMGSTETNVRTQSLPGGGVLGYDPQTGKVIYEIPGKAGGGSSGGSTKLYGNSTSGYFTMQGGKLVPVPGYTGSSAGGKKGVSTATASTTIARANDAGEAALEKVTDRIWAKTGNPPETIKDSSGNTVANPQYQKAVAWYNQQLSKSFGSAMYRVITAIAPHLKAAGYSKAQIKVAAYGIVSAEMDPPKGYKVPTAKPVSYSEGAQTSQFANYTGPTPPDNVILQQYKSSRPLPDTQLVQILRQAGFSGQGLVYAYSIAKRESGGNPLAFNPNRSTGDRSWGLFQINTLGSMAGRVQQFGLSSEMQLLDALNNAKAAYRMTDGGKNWYHWGVDTGYGAYRNAGVRLLPLPGSV